MLERTRRFAGLPSEQRWQLVQAALCLPVCSALIPLLGLKRFASWIGATPFPPSSVGDDPARLREIARQCARSVDRASRHGLVPGDCLSRSLTLCWMLRRRGLVAALHLGGRKRRDTIEAHAWVSFGGEVLNDQPDVGSRYPAFGDGGSVLELIQGRPR